MASESALTAAGEETDAALRGVVDALRAHGPAAAFQTALRTRSPLAVRAIAELASPGHDVEDLAARARLPIGDGAAIDGEYLHALAGICYSQQRIEDSRALYELAERNGAAIPAEHQTWYARSVFYTGGDLEATLKRLADLPETVRLGLEADAAHPGHGGDEAAWLERFRLLTGMDDLVLTPDPGAGLPLFDRLAAAPARAVRSKVKISIIMTCYRPGPELRTAVRSVLAQTWQHWELLLVDDCSGEEYHPILAECEAMDPRIKLILLPSNGGTYRARNRALVECSGTIITGLDSDDWAHPVWLERQSAPILQDDTVVLSISSAVRAFEDLTVSRSSRSIHSVRSTSIMFLAGPVRERMGFFDDVRKGADTEFRMRFATVFGDRAIRRMTKSPLAIVRLSESSLTSSEFGMGWLHPYRWVYQSGQKHWHGKVRERRADPFISAATPQRPFFAPAHLQSGKHDLGPFDEVHIADARHDSPELRETLRRAADAADAGLRVAFIHQESLLKPHTENRRLRPVMLETLHRHRIAFLSPTDEAWTSTLVVSDRSLWEGREDEYRLQCSGGVEYGGAGVEPAAPAPRPSRIPRQAAPQPRPQPQRQPRKAPTRRRRGVWAFSKPALTAVAAVYALAAVLWTGVSAEAGAVALFWALAATLFAAVILGTVPGFQQLTRLTARKRR